MSRPEPMPSSHQRRLSGTTIAISFGLILAALLIGLTWRMIMGEALADEVWLLSGPKGGRLELQAIKYRAALKPMGITVHIVNTGGSQDNLLRLRNPTTPSPCLGFVEAGIERLAPRELNDRPLISLGSLQVEPAWLFVRKTVAFEGMADLADRRVIMGIEGSGAQAVATELLRSNGILDRVEGVRLDAETLASQADVERFLIEQAVDGVFVLGDDRSKFLSLLATSQQLKLVPIKRAEAYVMKSHFLTAISVPQGLLDLPHNVPQEKLTTLGLTLNLCCPRQTHPALIDAMLMASEDVWRHSNAFSESQEFPNPNRTSLPVSRAARRFYDQGPSGLRKFLPFWLATLLERFQTLLVTLASFVTLAITVLPKLANARFTWSLTRIYRELEQLERRPASHESRDERLAIWRELEQSSLRLRVPRKQRAAFFELRQNIHDLGERLNATAEANGD